MNNVIKNLLVNSQLKDIGADADNISWNNEKTLKQILGDLDFGSASSLTDFLNQQNATIEELNTKLQDLTTLYNTLYEIVTTLQNAQIIQTLTNLQSDIAATEQSISSLAAQDIKWDHITNRTLSTYFGNLDNMPYKTLRDWLEHLSTTSGGGAVWQLIPVEN